MAVCSISQRLQIIFVCQHINYHYENMIVRGKISRFIWYMFQVMVNNFKYKRIYFFNKIFLIILSLVKQFTM